MNVQIANFDLGDNTLWLDRENKQSIAAVQETALDWSKILFQSNYHSRIITLETYLQYSSLVELQQLSNSLNSVYYFKYYDFETSVIFDNTSNTTSLEIEPLLNMSCAASGITFYKTIIHLLEI